jgi:hypothetical protein
MLELEEGIQQLQAEFSEARIPTDSPGFYEDFQFIRREQKDPTYLDNYARFVQWQDYHAAYLDKAERVIHVVVAEMQLALQQDGTSDAYAETPLVMSRILEREGIWNYVVCGALNVTFPPGSGFEPVSFWAVDADHGSGSGGGYQWVCAPPFQVIDLAVQVLKYPCPVAHLLPRTILGNDGEEVEGYPAEILSPTAIDEIRGEGLSLEEGLDRLAPGFRGRFAADFPAHLIRRADTQFKYVPTGVVAPDTALEEFKGFVSKGLTAMQIYDQNIRPRLLKE